MYKKRTQKTPEHHIHLQLYLEIFKNISLNIFYNNFPVILEIKIRLDIFDLVIKAEVSIKYYLLQRA